MFSFAKKWVDKLDGATHAGETDAYFHSNLTVNNHGFGLRVLHVAPQSLAESLQFEAWFDFIVAINNHELPMKNPYATHKAYSLNDDGTLNYGSDAQTAEASEVDFDLLAQELATIASSPNTTVSLDVWSAKGGVMRNVTIQLDRSNLLADTDEPAGSFALYRNCFSKIGLTLLSQHLNTATHVWKILNTHQASPAFKAQLIPHSDYIIGCDSAFPTDTNGKGLLARGGEALLSKTVSSYYQFHNSKLQDDKIPIILYVYNHDYDVLRPVTVHLSRSWSHDAKKGILGCDVGYGLLHRLPVVVGKFESDFERPDDVIFENPATISYSSNQTGDSQQPEVSDKLMESHDEDFFLPPHVSKTDLSLTSHHTPATDQSPIVQLSTEPEEMKEKTSQASLLDSLAMDGDFLDVNDDDLPPGDDIYGAEDLSPYVSEKPLEPDHAAIEAVLPGETLLPSAALSDDQSAADAFSEIPLNESKPDEDTSVKRNQTPEVLFEPSTAPSENVAGAMISDAENVVSLPSHATPIFSPMKGGPPPPPTAKPGRKKRTHGPANVDLLTSFMNEELSKSKEKDVMYGATADGESNGIPPPPTKARH